MSSMPQAHAEPIVRLNAGLTRIRESRTHRAAMTALTQAAHDLAATDGLCVLFNTRQEVVSVVACEAFAGPYEDTAALHRLMVAGAAEVREPRLQRLLEVEVHPGDDATKRIDALLVVPLGASSECAAIGFFWCDGTIADPLAISLLPALAVTGSLALQVRRLEDDSQRGFEQQQTWTHDSQHRLRNTLALVRSMVRHSSEVALSTEEFALHLEARIAALARAQGALAVDGHSGAELEGLIRAELTAHAVREHQFAIDGPSLHLATRATEMIALTVHELITNSLKFGALTTDRGHITTHWSIENDATSQRLRWSWIENGVDIAAGNGHRRGFGRELIERVLPYEFDARASFTLADHGVRCEIDLPLTDKTLAKEFL